jgi:hypothetical protein
VTEAAKGHRFASSSVNRTTEHEASRNITLMLIATSFLYTAGTLPYMLSNVVAFVNPAAAFENDLITVGSFFIIIFPGVKLFVYAFFNKLFRQQLVTYLRAVKILN